MTKYSWMWLIWALLFGVIEYKAITNKKEGDTLSEHVWKLIGTNTPGRNWHHWLFRGGLGIGLGWLIVHFFTGAI